MNLLQFGVFLAVFSPLIKSESLSGPFLRHTVTQITATTAGTAPGTCNITLNDIPIDPLRAPSQVLPPLTNPALILHVNWRCLERDANTTFDGTLQINAPATTAFFQRPLLGTELTTEQGSMRSTAVINGQLILTSPMASTLFQLNASLVHGTQGCPLVSDRRPGLSPGTVGLQLASTCENGQATQRLLPAGEAPVRGSFQTVEVTSNFSFDMTYGNGQPGFGGRTQVMMNVVSLYSIAPPAVTLESDILRVQANTGTPDNPVLQLRFRNSGGGLLDWRAGFAADVSQLAGATGEASVTSGSQVGRVSLSARSGAILKPEESTAILLVTDTSSLFASVQQTLSAWVWDPNGTGTGEGQPRRTSVQVMVAPNACPAGTLLPQCKNEVHLTSVAAPAAGFFDLRNPVSFAATARAQARTTNGFVALRAVDNLGNVRLSSERRPIAREDGPVVVTLSTDSIGGDTITLADVKQLTLRALLFDGTGRVLAESSESHTIWFENPEVSIERVEVSQATQSEQLDIPLINPGIPSTVTVRVFPKLNNSVPERRITAVLRDSLRGTVIKPVNGPVAVRYGAALNRNAADGSLNFEYPLAGDASRIAFELEVRDESGIVLQPAKSYEFAVQPPLRKAVRLLVVPFCYQAAGQAIVVCPDRDRLDRILDTVRALFPVDVQVSYAPESRWTEDLTRPDSQNHLLVALRQMLTLHQSHRSDTSQTDLVAGYLPFLERVPPGMSAPVWMNGSGDAFWFQDSPISMWYQSDGSEPGATVAHQMAHLMGLRHTNTICGDSDGESKWPFGDSSIGEAALRTFYDFFSPYTLSQRLYTSTVTDLMGRCPPRWISPFTYRQILRSGLKAQAAQPSGTPFEAGAVPGSEPGRVAPLLEQAVVSGSLRPEGIARLTSVIRVSTASFPDASDAAGNVCLVVQGGSGELSRHCFPMTFDIAGLQEGQESPTPLAEAGFVQRIAFPQGATRISMQQNGRQVASIAASANVPRVAFTAPQGLERWEGGVRQLRWSGSDADGDSLSYTVLYATEESPQWRALVVGTSESQLTIDTALLEGGTQMQFRVLASDGFHTGIGEAAIELNRAKALETNVDQLDFRTAVTGLGAFRVLTLRNTGTAPVRIAAIDSTNPSFQARANLPIVIGAKSKLDLPVRFLPDAVGEQTATLSAGTGAEAVRIAVKGTGVDQAAADLVITPSPIRFPRVEAGRISDVLLRLTNYGATAVTVDSVSTASPAFSVPASSLPIEVGASQERIVLVRFAPSDTGEYRGVLSVGTQDASNPVSYVPLEGFGVAAGQVPSIVVSPQRLDFGSIGLGTSRELPVTIQNTGKAELVVSAITVSGAAFSVTPSRDIRIAAGAAQTVTVRFAPTTSGTTSGTLAIASDDPNFPVVITTLAGTGVVGSQSAVISIDNAIFVFGDVPVGDSRSLTLNVRNNGGAELRVSSIVSSDPQFGAAPASFNVAPGAQQVVTITFSPAGLGVRNATLAVQSNDPNNSAARLSVSGNGVPRPATAALSITPLTLDFGTIAVGESRNLSVLARNTGSIPLTIFTIASSNPQFTLVNATTPLTLNGNSDQSIIIRFSSVTAGTFQGTVTFTSSVGTTVASLAAVATSPSTNPVPAIQYIAPAAITAGGPGTYVTVTGSNFVLGSRVQWNGSDRATTFESPTRLRAEVTAADIEAAGSPSVRVVTPAPGGGTSGTFPVLLSPAGPSITIHQVDTRSCSSLRVIVTATDNIGNPITALAPSALTLRDGGTQVSTTITSGKENASPLLLVIAFDVSSNIPSETLTRAKTMARALIDGLDPADRVAVVQFASSASVSVAPTAMLEDILGAVESLPQSTTPGTALYDALELSRRIAAADAGIRKAIVVFSGGPNTSGQQRDSVATLGAMLNERIPVFAFQSTTDSPSVLLSQLTASLEGKLYPTATLDFQAEQLGRALSNQYIVQFQSAGAPGYRLLELNMNSFGRQASTARYYPACQ